VIAQATLYRLYAALCSVQKMKVDYFAGLASFLRGGPRAAGVWRSWFLRVTAGEFLGFAGPALVGAVLAEARPVVLVPALLAAGAVEGSVLGWAQAGVLRRVLPGLPSGRFVLATVCAAVLAWMLGLLPVLLGERLAALPLALVLPGAVVAGTLLLASIGTAQWFVLRGRLPHAGRWIPATSVAWMAGLGAFTAVSSPLWQPGQPVWLIAAIGGFGGLVMAATVAATTGAALCWLLAARKGTSP
jgi:hypothetical protein